MITPKKEIINSILFILACWVIIILTLILFFDSCNAYAGIARNDWTKTDTALLVAGTTLHILDWGQTLDIARQPDRFHEHNGLMGAHPSVGKVNTIMVGGLIAQTVIPMITPKEYRWIWWTIWIGGKGAVVAHNYSIGLKVRF